MDIKLKNFGVTLTSRQSGKDAYSAQSNFLGAIKAGEIVFIDFAGVNTFSPSWGDEFLSPLYHQLGERLILKSVHNSSVTATIKILEDTNGIKFRIE